MRERTQRLPERPRRIETEVRHDVFEAIEVLRQSSAARPTVAHVAVGQEVAHECGAQRIGDVLP